MTAETQQGKARTIRAISTPGAVLDPEHLQVADTPVPLPPGHLACLACGVAVSQARATGPVVVAEALGREGDPSPGIGSKMRRGASVELLRCAVCTEHLEVAHALLAEHPRVAVRLGTRNAEHRAECCIDALAALAAPMPAPASTPHAVVASMLRYLTAPGATSRWEARFAPALSADARIGTCGPYPWSHVRDGQRAALREGYAAVLRERVALSAPPIGVGPPPAQASVVGVVRVEHGCLMCGAATHPVPAAQVARLGGTHAAASRVWRPASVTHRADRVSGHLCPSCTQKPAGSWGPAVAQRAFLAHLDADAGRADDAARMRTLVIDGNALEVPTYAALVADAVNSQEPVPQPSTEPWEHLTAD